MQISFFYLILCVLVVISYLLMETSFSCLIYVEYYKLSSIDIAYADKDQEEWLSKLKNGKEKKNDTGRKN